MPHRLERFNIIIAVLLTLSATCFAPIMAQAEAPAENSLSAVYVSNTGDDDNQAPPNIRWQPWVRGKGGGQPWDCLSIKRHHAFQFSTILGQEHNNKKCRR